MNTRRSARWLKKEKVNQERATGTGAALIKRKLYNLGYNEDSDEDTDVSEPRPKKRRPRLLLKDEELNLKCEWVECNHVDSNYNNFTKHVFTHLYELSGEKEYKCEWGSCSFKTSQKELLEMHLSHHPYFAKLTQIGRNNIKRSDLPECQMSEEDLIPNRKYPFECDWEDCNVFLYRIQDYFYHVECHAFASPSTVKKNNREYLKCLWLGCKITPSAASVLHTHLRSHTQEKLVACPTCKSTFSCVTKFMDHLKRQTVGETQFQCSHCYKYFATESLLRNHVRMHINNLKCVFCDMTCITRSELAQHIRYRHISTRPLKCELCEHRCVTKKDLNVHMMTHCPEKLFQCAECSFRCRSMAGLDRHYNRDHNNGQIDQRVYECHCCYKTYTRGAILTKHLIDKHNYQWPSGHSRFRYKQDPGDGMYRLQTVRFETIEATQEIISGPLNQQSIIVENFETNLKSEEKSNGSALIGHSNLVPTKNHVLITICEVDSSGNTLKTETVESKELRIAKSE